MDSRAEARLGGRARRIIVALVVAVAAVGAGGCAFGCPTALAEGVLVAEGDSLVMRGRGGETNAIDWPDGYVVRRDAAGLVLTDLLGSVKAREGDLVRAGGGYGSDDEVFEACGEIVVVPG